MQEPNHTKTYLTCSKSTVFVRIRVMRSRTADSTTEREGSVCRNTHHFVAPTTSAGMGNDSLNCPWKYRLKRQNLGNTDEQNLRIVFPHFHNDRLRDILFSSRYDSFDEVRTLNADVMKSVTMTIQGVKIAHHVCQKWRSLSQKQDT